MENKGNRKVIILIVDDDEDDVLNVKNILEKQETLIIKHVENGEKLIDYVLRQGDFQDEDVSPYPSLILLDIKMPKKNGFEALEEIKNDERLKSIPIVILTSSNADIDIKKSYELGANSFITKPCSFIKLREILEVITEYWFGIVELPEEK